MPSEKVIRDYMEDVLVLQENTLVKEAMSEMLKQKQRLAAIVLPNLRILGVLTYSDIIRELNRDIKSSRILTGSVETIMRDYRDFAFAEPNDTMLVAMDQMVTRNIRSVVIIDKLSPVGVLKQEKVIEWWLEVVAPSQKS